MANEPIIGGAKVRITVDNAQLDAALAASQARVQEFSDAAQASADGGIKGLGQAIERKTEGLRKLQGAVTSAVGAVTGFVSVIGSLIGALTLLGKALNDRFEETMRVNRAVGEVSVKFQELQHEAQRAIAGTTPTGLAAQYEEITKKIDDLDRAFSQAGISQSELVNVIRPQLAEYERALVAIAKQQDETAKAAKRAEDAEKRLAAARSERAESEAKVITEREKQERRISDLRRQLRQAESEEERQLIQEAIEFEAEARRKAMMDTITDFWRRWQEEQDKANRAQEDAIRRQNEARIRALNEELRLRERMRFGDSNQSFINAGIAGRPSILPRQGGVFEGRVD